MAIGDPLIVPEDQPAVTPPDDPVKCETCLYFRAFSPEERTDARGVILADGWCRADPPTPSIRQVAAPISAKGAGAVIEPMHRPVKAGDLCRLWRQDFAGDVSLAVADALESIDANIGKLVRYVAEAVSVGRKG